MRPPVIGIIGGSQLVENRFPVHRVGEQYMRTVAEVTGAVPLMFAGDPAITDIGALLDTVDGVLLTGARANVHPTHYGDEPSPRYEPYDELRDALALALVPACVERGMPIFGVCRGLQEMNVAFGGTLHPEIRELPGRQNHRMPRLENGEIHPDLTLIYGERHDVHLVKDGAFARLYGRDVIRVNSLHGQGILKSGSRIVTEGIADDGTIEAISIEGAPSFALGVQWHAEHNPAKFEVNRIVFQAFGEAVKARRDNSQQ